MDYLTEPDLTNPDEAFAEAAVQVASDNSIHLEYGGVFDRELGCYTYYAMAMPADMHTDLVARIAPRNDFLNRTQSPTLPLHICVPADRLEWVEFVAQPTYVEGALSREEAIEASLKACSALY